MKLIIASVLNIALDAGGDAGGTMLRPQASDMAAKDADGKKADGKDKKGDKKKGKEGEEVSDYYHVKFSRPFIVPVADGWRTQSLIVITLNVEMHNDISIDTPNLQEKMRDKMMTGLVSFSHEGGFAGSMTDPVLYEKIRQVARESIETMYPEKVGDVLILEMLRRNV